MQSDMEATIHLLEQEAYTSVLRAFKSQSDAITWEKESLITELRKELRVSDDEHRKLISRVNSDDIIRRIREWRNVNGLQPCISNAHLSHDLVHSPMASGPRKKQKTSRLVASMSLGDPSPTSSPPRKLSSSSSQQSSFKGATARKLQSYSSTGFIRRSQIGSRVCSGAFAIHKAIRAERFDSSVGRKVRTRLPQDNSFHEAVIADYDRVEMSPEDIIWDDDAPRISHRGGHHGPGRGLKKAVAHGDTVLGHGRGRGFTKCQPMDFHLSENDCRKKLSSNIKILHTDTLIKEVETVVSAYPPSPAELERAKEVLKEHEHALVEAIIRLGDASDGESVSRKQSSDISRAINKHGPGWRKRQTDEKGTQ